MDTIVVFREHNWKEQYWPLAIFWPLHGNVLAVNLVHIQYMSPQKSDARLWKPLPLLLPISATSAALEEKKKDAPEGL